MRRFFLVAILIALFGVCLYVVGARVAPLLTLATPGGDDDGQAGDIEISGPPSFQTLTLDGQVVLERAGSHFGVPRISPDGTLMSITVVPAGTETIGLAEIYLIERATGRVLDRIPGHNPRWQAGPSNRLDFDQLDAGGIRRATYDMTDRSIIRDETLLQEDNPAETEAAETAAMTYPETIRVAHHPENNCRRNVPDWQVDVIPFEEYVARSVPAEVPISWPPEALAAQSVATRTYAWYQIRRKRRHYDVTDWANFQMMCNGRYKSTDAAVARTAGQYLAYAGDSARAPIIAMYSAKNSHPTLTNRAVPYLQAVADEAGLGEELWGHGYGLSQWGAVRRAKEGQTYRQLLGHYYTDVTLQNARQPRQAIGGFTGLSLKGYLPVGGLRWGALVPAESLPGRVALDPGPDSLPLRGVWRGRSDLASGDTLTATLSLNDQLQESVSLKIDWEAPAAPTFDAPSVVEVQRAPLSFERPEPGACIGLSNGWIWQGENLHRTTGENIDDAAADGGRAKAARADEHEPGWWYGPYTTEDIPHGKTYRALFRLRMGEPVDDGGDNILPDRPIARLDVTDRAGTLYLGLRDIWPSDFSDAGHYVDVPVDFHLFKPAQGLEFRVKWHGEVDLVLDRVQLWQLLLDREERGRSDLTKCRSKGRIDWPLRHSGISTVSAIAFDAAGNASPVVTREIEFGSEQPPVFGELEGLQGWWTRLPVRISVSVQDYNSGLDGDSGLLLLDDQPQKAHFSRPNEPLAKQALAAELTDLADGAYSVRFQAKDRAGLEGKSELGLLRIDRTPPVVQAVAVQDAPETPTGSGTEGGNAGAPADEQSPAATATPDEQSPAATATPDEQSPAATATPDEQSPAATATPDEQSPAATATPDEQSPAATATPDEQSPAATATPAGRGVFSGPVKIVIDAEDAISGVWGIAYVLNDGPVMLYSEPFHISEEGIHHIRYWAKDKAGNYTRSHRLRIWVRTGAATPSPSEEAFVPIVRGEG